MAHIEHHPENGDVPWVVRTTKGSSLWVAFRTKEDAEKNLPDVAVFEVTKERLARQRA